MTILNFIQNNHTSSAGPAAARATNLRWHILSGWVNHLAFLNQQAGDAIRRLQNGPAAGEQEKGLTELARLRHESATGLQRLAALLGSDKGDKAVDGPPSSHEANAWIWLSLQYFFEEWNPETADAQLWLLARPVFCGERQGTEKEKEEAASFYELTKLLIAATWALYQQHTNQNPAP